MIRELFQELKVYFNNIENPTKEEKSFRDRLNSGFFPITSVHREDLAAKGFDTSKISDEDMNRLASLMSISYVSDSFHESMIDIAINELGLKK